MSGESQTTDPGAEREVDLRRWWEALLRGRWYLVGGLAIGLVVGGLYSLSGGTSYSATALIAPGEAFNPSGSTAVLTYLTSQTAINELANQTSTLSAVAAMAGMSANQLRGRVTTSAVNQGTGTSSANRNAVLVQITVKSNKPKNAERAANALAAVIRDKTTSPYVRQSISIYGVRLSNYKTRVATLQKRITSLNTALNAPGNLAPLDRLVLVSELDQAEAALGSTLNSQTTTEQQQTLSQSVEQTQIISLAKAQKLTTRSRANSLLFGGLIGLLAGAVVAVIAGMRTPRTHPA